MILLYPLWSGFWPLIKIYIVSRYYYTCTFFHYLRVNQYRWPIPVKFTVNKLLPCKTKLSPAKRWVSSMNRYTSIQKTCIIFKSKEKIQNHEYSIWFFFITIFYFFVRENEEQSRNIVFISDKSWFVKEIMYKNKLKLKGWNILSKKRNDFFKNLFNVKIDTGGPKYRRLFLIPITA